MKWLNNYNANTIQPKEFESFISDMFEGMDSFSDDFDIQRAEDFQLQLSHITDAILDNEVSNDILDDLVRLTLNFSTYVRNELDMKFNTDLFRVWQRLDVTFHDLMSWTSAPNSDFEIQTSTYFQRLLVFEILRRLEIIKLEYPVNNEYFKVIGIIIGQKSYKEVKKKLTAVNNILNRDLTSKQKDFHRNSLKGIKKTLNDFGISENLPNVSNEISSLFKYLNTSE